VLNCSVQYLQWELPDTSSKPLAREGWHQCLCLACCPELSLEVEEPKAVVELVDASHEVACQPETNLWQ